LIELSFRDVSLLLSGAKLIIFVVELLAQLRNVVFELSNLLEISLSC
jgi:hypothetical protein